MIKHLDLIMFCCCCRRQRMARAAEEGGIACLRADTDIKNTESLQRGARNFMNYCSGCHSLKYLRYNRMAEDLKIPESELAA
jgi:ubiquinol-cytochrome c reductase cytochrome c1 subunit